MNNPYLGRLDYADPLYEILFSQVCPDVKGPLFHVNKMASGRVYKYTEEKSRIAIIGKFFRLDDTRRNRIVRIKSEYDNLKTIRAYGFDIYPNYVVRPISRDENIGLALIEEFIQGKDLDYYLKKAIFGGDGGVLKEKLSQLASFLFALHEKTGQKTAVNLDLVSAYFMKVLKRLHTQTVISDDDSRTLLGLMEKWLDRTLIQNAKDVILHGDATPTNFLFTKNGGVVAIDLERMKNGDKAFDVGMVCGELKHAFLWRTGNPFNAEQFIKYFLKKYAMHSSDDKNAFRRITLRTPFYMALTELRIARNSYLDWNYRKRLVYEAMECLRWGLKLG